MNEIEVLIRALTREDAAVSCLWRNDPDIWRYTGKRPDREVTLSMEEAWYDAVARDPARRNFAVCVNEGTNSIYVGNAYLTHLTKADAQFHIFIGCKAFWGRGVGTAATKAILEIARYELALKRVWLAVQRNHKAAIAAYVKAGFVPMTTQTSEDELLMEIIFES